MQTAARLLWTLLPCLAALFLSPTLAGQTRQNPPAPSPGPAADRPSPTTRPASDADVYAALQRRLPEVSLQDLPFEQAVRWWTDVTGLNVHVHSRELRDEGLRPDVPVSLHLRDLPAERVLELMLADAGGDLRLAFDVLDGVIEVASRDSLERYLVSRRHPLGDLLSLPAGFVPPQKMTVGDAQRRLGEELLETLRTAVAPDSWDVRGGRGVLTIDGDALLVTNTPAVQRQVEELLGALRSAPQGGVWLVDPAERRAAAADQAAWTVLHDTTIPEARFENVAFEMAMDWFQTVTRLNLYMPGRALNDAGVRPDALISYSLKDVTVERSLQTILREAGGSDVRLGYAVARGVLLVGPPDFLGREESLRVYDVSDLLTPERGSERLAELLQSNVDPDSWAPRGGRGSVQVFRGRLVVRNALQLFPEIERFLAELRRP